MLGKGRFTPYSDADLARLADTHGWHPATLEAIAVVESGGSGVFAGGRMKVLPEPHIFWRQLPQSKRAEALRQGLATRSYAETKASGHYKRMTAQAGPRYSLLLRWIAYDAKAAYEAISMGRFQHMGFNAALLGFASAKAMFDAYCDSERRQLEAFATFLLKKGLKAAVRDRDFLRIETVYNGGGQDGAYARKMAAEDKRLRAGKWEGYQAGGMSKPVMEQPATAPGVLRIGDRGDAVEAMQMRLVDHGFPVQPDGRFGKLTDEAVRAFQAARGLDVDGVVGPRTDEALDAEPAPDSPAPSTMPARIAIGLLLAAGTGLAWLGNVPCVAFGAFCGG